MKILHLEDNPRDAELIGDMLSVEWPQCVVRAVSSPEAYLAALGGEEFDLILSDYRIPHFSGLEALAAARARRPDTPFIFVSGTVGEDKAVELVRAGAADYLLKDRLQRLPVAIRRALDEARERKEKKVLEEKFFRAQRLESLGMLAAGIAHDLNNALAPTLMAGQILRMRTTNPEDLRFLDLLERSASRGASLVKQILSFASGGSSNKTIIQTKHLLRDIVEMIRQTFPRSIQLNIDLPGDLWTVQGNPTQLHQILLNLCINARDAMPDGGTLTIRAQNREVKDQVVPNSANAISGNYLVLEVSDTGTGIPPEFLARIWEPFFTTKGEGKGTGLGLSTVAGIAASHGGFVTVDSPVGQGATFRVFLPAIVEAAQDAPKPGSAHPFAARGGGQLVFVADDDANVRESVMALLTQQGYRVMTMNDGMEALAQYAIRASEVALVISDFDMPRLNGRALAQAIRLRNPAAKILFMSGSETADHIQPVVTTLGARWLSKPFSPASLMTTVNEMVGTGPTPGDGG